MARIRVGYKNPQRKAVQLKRGRDKANKNLAKIGVTRISRILEKISAEAISKRIELINALHDNKISQKEYQRRSVRIDAWLSTRYKEAAVEFPQIIKQAEVTRADGIRKVSKNFRDRRAWVNQELTRRALKK